MLRGCSFLSCSLRSHEIFGGREFLAVPGIFGDFWRLGPVPFGLWSFWRLGFLAKSGFEGGIDVETLKLVH